MQTTHSLARAALVLIAALATAQCGASDAGPAAAFVVEADGTTVRLQRAALGRAFLLRSRVSEVGDSDGVALWPMPVPVMPRVVRFVVHDDRLALYAIDRAAWAGAPGGRERLLETFALLPAPSGWLAFRWHGGLQSLSLAQSVADGGRPSAMETELQLLLAITPQSSFLRAAAVAGETLRLEQDSRLAPQVAAAIGLPEPIVLHVSSTVAPYVPDAGFAPRAAAGAGARGFFALRPDDAAAEARLLAIHWQRPPDRPLQVALAAGFTAAERAAIADGMAYWNRLAGRPLLRVAQAAAEGGWDQDAGCGQGAASATRTCSSAAGRRRRPGRRTGDGALAQRGWPRWRG